MSVSPAKLYPWAVTYRYLFSTIQVMEKLAECVTSISYLARVESKEKDDEVLVGCCWLLHSVNVQAVQ